MCASPNENLIKSEITNLTRFSIRRVDVPIGVAHKQDLEKAFDEHGIEIPFPHGTLYTGSETLPLKVQLEPPNLTIDT